MERLTIEELIDISERDCKVQENTIRYLEGMKEFEYYIAPHKEAKKQCEQIAEYLKELKKYKDLEEQGLLLRLPCKPHDTLYVVDGKNIQILEAENAIAIVSGVLCIYAENYHYADYISYDMLGKTVFLTKAEAELKLKEMECKEELEEEVYE